jgi:hypothetical protein
MLKVESFRDWSMRVEWIKQEWTRKVLKLSQKVDRVRQKWLEDLKNDLRELKEKVRMQKANKIEK